MNAKLRSRLAGRGCWPRPASATHGVPLIRDGLYAHHRDLGGALYLYFDDPGRGARGAAPPGADRRHRRGRPERRGAARPPPARARRRPDLLGGPGRRPRRLGGRAARTGRDGTALARLQARAANPDAGDRAGRAGRRRDPRRADHRPHADALPPDGHGRRPASTAASSRTSSPEVSRPAWRVPPGASPAGRAPPGDPSRVAATRDAPRSARRRDRHAERGGGRRRRRRHHRLQHRVSPGGRRLPGRGPRSRRAS